MSTSPPTCDLRHHSFVSVTAVAIILAACGCRQEVETSSGSAAAPDDHVSVRETSSSEKAGESSTDAILASAAGELKARGADENYAGSTFYIKPTGDGRKDGSDWPNAAAAADLQELLSEKVAAGDRVVLGSGNFPRISVPKGGFVNRFITITGFDTGNGLPIINGRWKETNPKYHAHSWNAISLADGVSHVRIGGLQISGFIYGVKATNNRGVELFDLSITRCR